MAVVVRAGATDPIVLDPRAAPRDLQVVLKRVGAGVDPDEALRLALQEIRDIVWEPKTTFPAVKRRVARVLAAVREREG